MEKMNKAYYVGTIERWSTAHLTDTPGEMTNIIFKNGTLRDNPWPFAPHEECYLVKKSDLDAYGARKEDLEKTKGTPDWYLSNRIKQLEAENANLRDINKSLGEEHSKLVEENEVLKDAIGKYYNSWLCGDRVCSANCELKAANEKLAAEVKELKERIDHLKIIQRLLAKENMSLRTENNNLQGTKNELDATVAKLRQDLTKYSGVQEIVDIRTTNDPDSYVLWWTGRNGDKHKLELKLVQNPMSEKMCREMDIHE